MAHRLCHGCEQDPVICIGALAIHLGKPRHDLCLLSGCHLVKYALAAHPDGDRDVGAFHDALIEMGEQVLTEGDAARAESIFSHIHDMDPDNPAVLGGLTANF